MILCWVRMWVGSGPEGYEEGCVSSGFIDAFQTGLFSDLLDWRCPRHCARGGIPILPNKVDIT